MELEFSKVRLVAIVCKCLIYIVSNRGIQMLHPTHLQVPWNLWIRYINNTLTIFYVYS